MFPDLIRLHNQHICMPVSVSPAQLNNVVCLCVCMQVYPVCVLCVSPGKIVCNILCEVTFGLCVCNSVPVSKWHVYVLLECPINSDLWLSDVWGSL